MASRHLKVEKIRLGFWASLWAVIRGVRLVRNQLWDGCKKITPNSPCPCGSGKKLKQCHMRSY